MGRAPVGRGGPAILLILGFGWGPVVERLRPWQIGSRWSNPGSSSGAALRAARDFPAFGVGLGGFRAVFPLYQSPRLYTR